MVKGRKINLIITVRTMIARPKSFQGRMSYKNTVMLKRGLNNISLKMLIVVRAGLFLRETEGCTARSAILLFRTLSGDRVFQLPERCIQNRSGGICSSSKE